MFDHQVSLLDYHCCITAPQVLGDALGRSAASAATARSPSPGSHTGGTVPVLNQSTSEATLGHGLRWVKVVVTGDELPSSTITRAG